MRVEFTFIAQAATFGANGLVDALGVGANQLMFASFPMSQPFLTVVTSVSFYVAESGEHTVEAQIVDPQGTQIATSSACFAIAPGTDPALPIVQPLILPVVNVPFAAPGPHTVRLVGDGTVLATLPLRVAIQRVSRTAG